MAKQSLTRNNNKKGMLLLASLFCLPQLSFLNNHINKFRIIVKRIEVVIGANNLKFSFSIRISPGKFPNQFQRSILSAKK